MERPKYVYGKKDLGLWTGQKTLLREVPNPVKLVAKHRNIVKLCMTDRDVSGQKASLGLQPQDKVSGMTQQAGTAPFLTFQASRTNIKTRPCAYTSQPHRGTPLPRRWRRGKGKFLYQGFVENHAYQEPCVGNGIVATIENKYFHNFPYFFCLTLLDRHRLKSKLHCLLAM